MFTYLCLKFSPTKIIGLFTNKSDFNNSTFLFLPSKNFIVLLGLILIKLILKSELTFEPNEKINKLLFKYLVFKRKLINAFSQRILVDNKKQL